MMEENNDQNTNKVSAEEIKKEAANAANEVKETFKNADIKKDVNVAKGFITNFFKSPIKEIETVANAKNDFLKIALIVLIVWVVATFLGAIISVVQSYSLVSGFYSSFGLFLKNSVENVLSIVKTVVAPLLSVAVLSGIVYVMAKDKKKPFIQTASAIVIAKVPVVIAAVANLLRIFGSQVYKLVNPFTSFCSIISTVLLYFAIKALYGEKDDNQFMKKFVIIMGIFYIAKFIISFLGISI